MSRKFSRVRLNSTDENQSQNSQRVEEVIKKLPSIGRRILDTHGSGSSENKMNDSLSPPPHHQSSYHFDTFHSMVDFSMGKMIGSGTYGQVFLALEKDTGKQFALKRLRCENQDPCWLKGTRSEIEILKSLQHENIVMYIGAQETVKGSLDIFLEYMAGGSVATLIQQHGALSEKLVARFTKQIVAGVKYLHENNIIHRDIKGANVLVSESGIAKLADFGCSRQIAMLDTQDKTLHSIRGSVPWMAPEMMSQKGVTYSADIWSLGATVLEMISGKRPWAELKESVHALFTIGTTKTPPPMPEELNGSLVLSFMLGCFVICPEDRSTARELQNHPFIVEKL